MYDRTRTDVTEDESSNNLRALQGKLQCFPIFYDVNMNTTSKLELTANFIAFPSVKLRNIWQTGSKIFKSKLVFSGKSIGPVFSQG